MAHENDDDPKLDAFLKSNAPTAPKSSAWEKQKLFAKIKDEESSVPVFYRRYWFLRLITPMALSLIAICVTLKISRPPMSLDSGPVSSIEVSQLLDENFEEDIDNDSDDWDY